MFENKDIKGIYISRFIASWVRVGGKLRTGKDYKDFRKWLESLGLEGNEVNDILFLAQNGKMELESSAKRFIANLNSN